MMEFYGPCLPPGFKKSEPNEKEKSVEHEQTTIATEKWNQPKKIIGPICPDFIAQKKKNGFKESGTVSSAEDTSPVCLFEGINDEDSDDDVIGPVPLPTDGNEKSCSYAIEDIEKRSAKMRSKLESRGTPTKIEVTREEWMTVPNTLHKNQLGIISRCLAPSAACSAQTQIGKKRKHDTFEDEEVTEELKKYNKSKRSKSLLEMHREEKMKKEKKSSKEPEERKPFDREDMMSMREIKKLSSKQVNSFVDKAKYLNTRFGSGASQYL